MPTARLSRQQIVATALAVVDEEGLDALTVRSVTKRLGVAPGAIYKHLPDMDQLREDVVWEVLAPIADLPLDGDTWQAKAAGRATALRGALREHPNLLPLLVGATGQRIWLRRVYAAFGSEIDTFIDLLAADGIGADGALVIAEALEMLTVGSISVAIPVEVSLDGDHALSPQALDLIMASAAAADDRFELAMDVLLEGLAARLRES